MSTNVYENRPFLSKYGYTILLLALLAVLAYGAAATIPSLMGDEWGVLNYYIRDGGPACPDWQTARPFGQCWSWLVHHTAGLNFHAHHAAAVLMNFITALLLLVVLDRLLPNWPLYNGAAAAVFLIFPSDMTRTFLAGNVAYGAGTYLVSACFLAAFWRHGRWWTWIAGMIFFVYALGTYEVGIGVALALSAAAFLFGKHRTWPQRLAFLAPAAAAIIFSVWRWTWQQSAEGTFGYDSSNVVFSPSVLIERLSFGARYSLQQAWTDTVLHLFPPLATNETLRIIPVTLIFIGLVLLPILIVYLLTRDPRETRPESAARDLKAVGAATLTGLLMVVAGYFPIILAQDPREWYAVTRTHHVSSIGAALVLAGIIAGVATLLARDARRTKQLALAGLIPLLALGVASHLLVITQTQRAWADQTEIWRSLFDQAPDIVDGTHVLVLLNEYNDVLPQKGPAPFIQGDWGTNNAIRLLYGNSSLYLHFGVGWPGRVLSGRGGNIVLSDFGLREFPAAETLVYVFGKNDRQLVRIPQIEADGQMLRIGADRIITEPTQATEYRWLVNVE
jgi:hypothetical protein